MAAFTCQSSSAGESYLRPWPANVPAPAFRLNDLEGKPWDIQELRGKVVVLNFWATWCSPCVDELPFLDALASSEAAKGQLVILGVNFKESEPKIRGFLNEHGVGYPILTDKTGGHFKAWTTGIMPTTILIDRNGRPRWRVIGELDATNAGFRQALERMLDEPLNAPKQNNTRRAENAVK